MISRRLITLLLVLTMFSLCFADNTLIRKHPEFINEMIDRIDLIDDCNTKLVIGNLNDIITHLSKIVYYELVTGETIVTKLLNINEYIDYYHSLKQLMEVFV